MYLYDLFFSASYESYVSVTVGRVGGVYVGYTGVRGTLLPLRETSLRCISNCLALRLRSSVASNSLFYHKSASADDMQSSSHPRDYLLDSLLMTLHLQKCFDLADCKILPISQSNKFIESAEKLVCISQYFSFVKALACAGNDLGKEV